MATQSATKRKNSDETLADGSQTAPVAPKPRNLRQRPVAAAIQKITVNDGTQAVMDVIANYGKANMSVSAALEAEFGNAIGVLGWTPETFRNAANDKETVKALKAAKVAYNETRALVFGRLISGDDMREHIDRLEFEPAIENKVAVGVKAKVGLMTIVRRDDNPGVMTCRANDTYHKYWGILFALMVLEPEKAFGLIATPGYCPELRRIGREMEAAKGKTGSRGKTRGNKEKAKDESDTKGEAETVQLPADAPEEIVGAYNAALSLAKGIAELAKAKLSAKQKAKVLEVLPVVENACHEATRLLGKAIAK